MTYLLEVISVYVVFLVPASIGLLFSWLIARGRTSLYWTDWLSLVLPWALWIWLFTTWSDDKSLSNIVEAFYLGTSVAILFAIRALVAFVGPRFNAPVSHVSLFLACVIGVGLWAFVPGLPE